MQKLKINKLNTNKMKNKLWFVLAFVFLIALTLATTAVIVRADTWDGSNVHIKA